MDNANSQEYLQKIKVQVIENLKRTTFAPSVQMTDVPRDPVGYDDEADAELDDLDQDENPDSRFTKRRWDKYVEKDGELSDSEDEDMNEENGVRKQPNSEKRRRNMMDFQNDNAAPDDDFNGEASGVLSARSGRSPNGANGAHGSNSEASEAEPIEGENGESLSSPARDQEDEDVDMADEPTTAASGVAKRAQEATPPESPAPDNTDVPQTTAPNAEGAEAPEEAMDEGDTLDDPELAKEEGKDEREQEDIAAEKATEVKEQAEA